MYWKSTRYTGDYAPGFQPFWAGRPVPAGHCRRCGEPSGACCCGCRECRKEAKELLFTPGAPGDGKVDNAPSPGSTLSAVSTSIDRVPGLVQGFIGGGCCVSLSVEYAPQTPTADFSVEVAVQDSEGTMMLWQRKETAGTGYRIKEGIITTKPGAKLLLLAQNCTARVRWCEVFSC